MELVKVTIDEQFGLGSTYLEFGNRIDLFLKLAVYFELSFFPSTILGHFFSVVTEYLGLDN